MVRGPGPPPSWLPVYKRFSSGSKLPFQQPKKSWHVTMNGPGMETVAPNPLNEVTEPGLLTKVELGPSWPQSMMSVGFWVARSGKVTKVSALATVAIHSTARVKSRSFFFTVPPEIAALRTESIASVVKPDARLPEVKKVSALASCLDTAPQSSEVFSSLFLLKSANRGLRNMVDV